MVHVYKPLVSVRETLVFGMRLSFWGGVGGESQLDFVFWLYRLLIFFQQLTERSY